MAIIPIGIPIGNIPIGKIPIRISDKIPIGIFPIGIPIGILWLTQNRNCT
jgi:hypothetical protein